MIPPDITFLISRAWRSVDPSTVDVDLTAIFAEQKFARALYNGAAAAANIAVTDEEGNTVTFSNVPSGTAIFGQFVKLVHTGTTATNMLAGK